MNQTVMTTADAIQARPLCGVFLPLDGHKKHKRNKSIL
jgi:hypothetical protein